MCGEANVGVLKDLMRFQLTNFVSTGDDTNQKLTLYPNPANHSVSFHGLTSAAKLQISDMQGKLWIEKWIEPGETLDVSLIPSGLYNCCIEMDGNKVFSKLTVF